MGVPSTEMEMSRGKANLGGKGEWGGKQKMCYLENEILNLGLPEY